MFDAIADPERRAALLRTQTSRAYARLFATDDGRVVLRDLFRFCGVARSSFAPGDPQTTSFEEGKRRVALRVAAMMRLNPETATEIAAENDNG